MAQSCTFKFKIYRIFPKWICLKRSLIDLLQNSILLIALHVFTYTQYKTQCCILLIFRNPFKEPGKNSAWNQST